MILKENYWFFENILSEQECDNIVKNYTASKLEDAVIIDSEDTRKTKIENAKRKTKVSWIDDRALFEKLAGVIMSANSSAMWNFSIDCGQEIQFGAYSVGDYFDWHCDQIPLPDTMDLNEKYKKKTRKLTICVALNDKKEYEGGDFQICYGQHDTYTEENCNFMFKKGNAIVFPSFLYHRVKEITQGTRYSLVMWGCGDPYQ